MMQEKPEKPALTNALREENLRLEVAWQRHDASFLKTYLIRDVQDPRINIQSILTRHVLIDALFGQRHAVIMTHELVFALTVHWLLSLLKSTRPRNNIHLQTGAILDRLLNKEHDTPGTPDQTIPTFMAEPFKTLAFPNYISDLLMWVPRELDTEAIPDYLLNTFQNVWAETLAAEQAARISVIEPACGSANDYRFLDRYGLGRFIRYTGVDLSAKNIHNAKHTYAEVDFQVGSVFDLPADDNAYDYCFVHDLLEHLSPEGIDRAVAELCRVTAKRINVHYFNMDDTAQDAIQKKGGYHWNRLSAERMHDRFAPTARHIESRRLNAWLKTQFAYPDYYNQYAWSWQIELQS